MIRKGHVHSRRELISLIGGAAAMPLAAHGQERVRTVGMLLPASPGDAVFQTRVAAFVQGLQQAGWVIGRNVSLEYRWTESNPHNVRKYAAELVARVPDVILADGSATVAALLQSTRTIPIVFPVAGDPVGAGYVETLARPGGNATGFMNFEYSISGKWLELLKQIAPNLSRVGVLRDLNAPTGSAQYGVIQAAAPAHGLDISPINVLNADEIERAIVNFAQKPNGGLIITATPAAIVHRQKIIELAERTKLPAIYFGRFFTSNGGLISYGPDIVDQYRRAAGYVDRILRGEKPADLPVQAPTKLETVINLKTAKALSITVPQTLLVSADEVIE
jgi:putative tryptophan/tyrosine transport system substrate-binding protein